MGIAAGGRIDQVIIQDTRKHRWDSSQTRWFNVQMLNCSRFQEVTGLPAPDTPVTIQAYASYGYPFYAIWEEKTTVAGDFSAVKSIGQIEGKVEPKLRSSNIVSIGRRPEPKTEEADAGKNNDNSKSRTSRLSFFGRSKRKPSASPKPIAPTALATAEVEVAFFQDSSALPVFKSMDELERHLA